MHPLQEKILEVAKLTDLRKYTYRELAVVIGCTHASQAKHHLEQLKKKGLLQIKHDGGLAATASVSAPGPRLPILGEADCGEATRYASDRIEGYLRLSPSLLPNAPLKRLYALRAKGDSMNRTNVGGNSIDDGDYVIVEKRELYMPEDNDIVVSVIDGMANIKCFRKDHTNQRVVLISQSTHSYPPIIVANEDLEQYLPIGKVVSIIKGFDNKG